VQSVVEDFGFDACIDYREENLKAALKQQCPRGSTSISTMSAGRSWTPSSAVSPPRHGSCVWRHLQLSDG